MFKTLLLFFLFVSCQAERFEIVDGKLLNNGKLFSGIRKFSNGSTRKEISYKNGLKHGKELHFYSNGQLYKDYEYLEGKAVGEHKTFYSNGNKKKVTQFKDGQHHGDYTSWYQSGQLFEYRRYEEGEAIGIKKWRPNGKIYANYVVKNGKNIGLTGGKLCFKAKDEVSE